MNIHWTILDDKRRKVLPLLKEIVGGQFYLAGGTGLALQIGHRDSIDFDFFTNGDYDTSELAAKIEDVFAGHKLMLTQREKNTLTYVIDDSIQVSFFGHKSNLVGPLVETEYFSIASIADIGCMKFSAITARSVEKDYVDLYFIFQSINLKDLLDLCVKKYPNLDSGLILKSLTYFDDIKSEPIIFKEGHKVSLEEIKKRFETLVKNYIV